MRVGVGGLRGQHPVDAPTAVLVTGDVRTEQPLPPVGPAAPGSAGGDVGVRGAQLAVDLPEQVDEVVVGGEPVQDRPVAVEHGGPVGAAEVGPPEVVAHEAAGLVVHLPPLGGRVDGPPDAGEVDGDVGVAVLVGGGAAVAGDDLEPAVGPQQHPLAVAGDGVVVGVPGEVFDALLDEVVALQVGLGIGVLGGGARGAEDALEGVAQPQHAVLGGPQGGVAGGLDGERDDPVGESVQVDTGGGGALAVGGLVLVGRVEGAAVPLRSERGRGGRRERDQMRAYAADERQVEDVFVVDRVEGAGGEERQVLAVEGEGGREVAEAQRGGLGHRQIGGVGELELAQRARAGVGPGEPGGVGREDQPARLAVLAAVDLTDLAAVPFDEQDPPVVRGDGGLAAVGRHGEPEHPAELPGGEPARGGAGGAAGGGRELQRVLALGVGDPHHPLLALRAEGARQPGAYAVLVGERAGGARAVGDPVHGTAYGYGAAAAGVVGGGGTEPAGGANRLGLEVDALPAEPDLQAARLGAVEVVQDPQLAGGGVDDTGAVGGRVAGVEAVDRGVAAQVGAVGEGGVEGAGALVVGEERQPVTDPRRVLQVAVQLLVQPDEFAVALAVDPQLARGAAAVPLPPGGLPAHGGGEQHRVRPVRDVADRAVGQGGGGAAVERDRAGPGAAQRGLAVGAEREHLAVGGPAADLGPGPPVRETGRGPAVQGREVHLGGAVAGGGPGEPGAVRGDAGMVHGDVVGADAPGAATVQGRDPDVVLGGEGDRVAVQMREPEIRGRCGLCHQLTLCTDRAARTGFRITCPPRASRWGRRGTRWCGWR